MDDFHGHRVQRLTSKLLEVDCLAEAGPRIVRLRYKGSPNLLAEVPDIAVATPYGAYHYLGGHRLWHAPELMPRSYIPDDSGLVTFESPDGVALQGAVEPDTGIRKRIEVRLDPYEPRIHLTHVLENKGLWEVELAPWAITMFHLGGTAILPTRAEKVDPEALLPDRHLSLWPYARLDDPRLKLEDDFIAVRPTVDLAPFKIGTFNHQGWTAYWLDGVLFRKIYATQTGLQFPDNGCNAEIYCDSQFIELESLGSLSRLAPGSAVALQETWEFHDSLDQSFLSQEMRQFLRADSS